MRDIIQKILDIAVFAPSGDNSQPWRFEVKDNIIRTINLPDKDNPVLNVNQSGSYIAHGALIENILIASRHYGYAPELKLFPVADNLNITSEILLVKSNPHFEPLFEYIKTRCTNWRKYFNKPLTEIIRRDIMNTNQELDIKNITLSLVEDPMIRKKLGPVLSSIEKVILENRELHDLIFKDVRWTKSEEQIKQSGLYIKTMGFSLPQVLIFWLASRWSRMKLLTKLGLPNFIAREDGKLYSSGCATGVLLLKDENDITYINAGRIMQKIWLKATRYGLSLQPVTSLPFAIKRLRGPYKKIFSDEHIEIIRDKHRELSELFHAGSATMTMPFRLGYAKLPLAITSRK